MNALFILFIHICLFAVFHSLNGICINILRLMVSYSAVYMKSCSMTLLRESTNIFDEGLQALCFWIIWHRCQRAHVIMTSSASVSFLASFEDSLPSHGLDHRNRLVDVAIIYSYIYIDMTWIYISSNIYLQRFFSWHTILHTNIP